MRQQAICRCCQARVRNLEGYVNQWLSVLSSLRWSKSKHITESVSLAGRKQIDYFSRSGAKAQREITHRNSSLRRCVAA